MRNFVLASLAAAAASAEYGEFRYMDVDYDTTVFFRGQRFADEEITTSNG